MKKLFRIIAALTMTAIAMLSFVGCGGGKLEDIESRTDKYGNTLVTIMVHKDSTTKEGMAYQKCVDNFNEAYKEQKIKASITFVAQTSGVDAYETTIMNLYKQGGGKLYDVMSFDAPKCAGYAQSGVLYNMTELLGDYTSEFIPSSINKYNDKVYGLPIQESSAGFYYNKSILNTAGVTDEEIDGYKTNGWTFAQFKDVCARIKTSGKTPVDMQLTAGGETSTYLLYPFGYSEGGEYVDSDGKTVKGFINSAATKNGFKFIKDCIDLEYTNYQINSTAFLADGTVGMYLSSGWTIPDINEKYKGNFGGGWGILPYPHAEGKAAVSAMGSWSFGITNNGVKNKSAALELIKWMTSDASADIITKATGMIPAKTSLGTTYNATSPEGVLYNQLKTSGKPRPAMAAYSDFSDEFNLILDALKTNSVDKALDDHADSLQSKVNASTR